MATACFGECPLCGRSLKLTFHHLIPKKLHRRTRFKKAYSKAELNQGVWICRLCHDGIHDHYDEMALAKHFPTLESIKTDPKIQRHAEWVAKQKVRC
ncbi:hypothetical protein [Leptolyngbya iicbica]|uniref:HNH domain-containing protein n=2 Tax=Cyanophyceae TaxID=3028117 RepID=A0A4Q7E3R2_9CYAN|nr:hypothetical protein [Leptolyngbya sp. LK]RZM76119.1 hypothetical protein DYY88_19745 [Leptolyngbya sp. LK]